MKFDIGAIFGQVVSLFVKLPLAQKIALPFLFLGTVGLIVFVSRWANQADYAVLFSGLADTDAAAIVEKLKEQKIGYRLRDDGRTVEITPPSMVHELRLDMASSGLPKGGNIGFELFDTNRFGLTNFVEKLNWVRAHQGELERTIGSIDAVKSVRVHITNPERSAFIKRDVLPSASVLLRLKPGAELTPPQIKGIANLVASSIERLTPENVTILDSHGNMLNEKKDPQDMTGAEITRLDYKHRLESSYVKQVETMLAGVLGPGKAIARVTAELDFSSFEKEEEAYDPGSKVTRSERAVEEASGATAEGGVPGVISNLTTDQGVLTPPDSGKSTGRKIESVRNYEVSRALSKTTTAPGKVQRLSVAVLVDGQYSSDPAAKKPADAAAPAAKIYKPLTADMMQKIENLVKQAVGFEGARGDVVTVENIRFFEPDETLEVALKEAEKSRWVEWGFSYALPALFIVLFFFVVLRPAIGFLVNPTDAEVDLSRLLPTGIEELEAELEAERGKVTAMPEIAAPAVDIEELEALLAENSRTVKDNPQQAALLIRYWLNEGRM